MLLSRLHSLNNCLDSVFRRSTTYSTATNISTQCHNSLMPLMKSDSGSKTVLLKQTEVTQFLQWLFISMIWLSHTDSTATVREEFTTSCSVTKALKTHRCLIDFSCWQQSFCPSYLNPLTPLHLAWTGTSLIPWKCPMGMAYCIYCRIHLLTKLISNNTVLCYDPVHNIHQAISKLFRGS